ncbi:diacylglycerol kinase epsilon-like [Epargyreus clarus]|uniref:diacylglycerol kinase epsilon-like n=1 Tax=Epargyreus clarus TaxID=520877 RepID=UPI003C2EEC19
MPSESTNETLRYLMSDAPRVTIKPHRGRLGRLGRLRGERRLLAHCYASVGVDAQVALDFHRARAQFLCRYASRWLNYAAYAVLGAGRALDAGGCGALERRVRVAADGRALPLPPVQALVLLNIRCWGAGVSLWNMGSEDVPEQSMSDGKFEVVGISSSIHIARLQCGLAEPFRFTQSSRVEWTGSRGCRARPPSPWSTRDRAWCCERRHSTRITFCFNYYLYTVTVLIAVYSPLRLVSILNYIVLKNKGEL